MPRRKMKSTNNFKHLVQNEGILDSDVLGGTYDATGSDDEDETTTSSEEN